QVGDGFAIATAHDKLTHRSALRFNQRTVVLKVQLKSPQTQNLAEQQLGGALGRFDAALLQPAFGATQHTHDGVHYALGWSSIAHLRRRSAAAICFCLVAFLFCLAPPTMPMTKPSSAINAPKKTSTLPVPNKRQKPSTLAGASIFLAIVDPISENSSPHDCENGMSVSR